MPSQEIETKFWKALKSDMTMMIGLDGEDDYPRPMTAQLDGDRGPIWFFTSKDTELFKLIGQGRGAIGTFVDKGHDLFATVHGALTVDTDRAVIDRQALGVFDRHVLCDRASRRAHGRSRGRSAEPCRSARPRGPRDDRR